ncbi:hypothetical protein JCM10207_006834 [Rhodosporidiobolus poonsookiae]
MPPNAAPATHLRATVEADLAGLLHFLRRIRQEVLSSGGRRPPRDWVGIDGIAALLMWPQAFPEATEAHNLIQHTGAAHHEFETTLYFSSTLPRADLDAIHTYIAELPDAPELPRNWSVWWSRDTIRYTFSSPLPSLDDIKLASAPPLIFEVFPWLFECVLEGNNIQSFKPDVVGLLSAFLLKEAGEQGFLHRHPSTYQQLDMAGCAAYFRMERTAELIDQAERVLIGPHAITLAHQLADQHQFQLRLAQVWRWFTWLRQMFGLQRVQNIDPNTPFSPPPPEGGSDKSPSHVTHRHNQSTSRREVTVRSLAHNPFRPASRRNFASSFFV